MRIKVNTSYNDSLYDFFEIRNIMFGLRSGNYYEAKHLIGRFSYNDWADKPVVLLGKYSQANQTADLYSISTPNIKGETVLYLNENLAWTYFDVSERNVGFNAVKNTMEKHYNIECEILYRGDGVTGLEIRPYGIKTKDGKYFCWLMENGREDFLMCYYGDFFCTLNREKIKGILSDEEYHHYRVNVQGRQDIDSGIFGDFDVDIVALDEMIPNFNKYEFVNNFITELSGIVGG